MAGGVISNSAGITNQGYAYDPATGRWSALPNLNAALYRGAGACGFYAVGGSQVASWCRRWRRSRCCPATTRAVTDVPWLSESTSTLTLAPGASRRSR